MSKVAENWRKMKEFRAMTNPELKVSEKVREIAEKWNADPMGEQYRQRLGELIQSSLSELLKAGRDALTWGMSSKTQWYQDFAAILSKWEPK